jgi:putative endonuclease
MTSKKWYVYILTNVTSTVLYIGVTSNLYRRIDEHKSQCIDWFSKRYNTKILIYYEEYDDIWQAIYREKCLKKRKREWKEKLIDELNPWREDLSLRLEI